MRSWIVIGVAAVAVVGLIGWGAVAIVSWLWGQAPGAMDAGKRIGGEAAARIEQAAPGLREQAEKWAPGLAEQLERWVPGLADSPPAQDVSGADIGPVTRYPGLVRSHFARDAQAVEVAYSGRAPFEAVLEHYVKGFTGAGYAQEVLSATPEGERHRFRADRDSFELSLARRPGGLVDVRLKQPARS